MLTISTLRRRHHPACFQQVYPPLGPTVMAVLRDHAPALWSAMTGRRLTSRQIRVLQAVLDCRQPGMGSHSWKCDACGNVQFCFNACHVRHCPSCRQERREEWQERLLGWSLPIDYLHCVFTLPHEFNVLFELNDDALYRLIFRAVSKTINAIAKEKFGCRVGIVMVLHTWGQRMNMHVHVHVIVTCGGLALDESSWVPFTASDYEKGGNFSKEVLSERYRLEFLKGIRRLFRREELLMPQRLEEVTTRKAFDKWLAPAEAKTWCVNVQSAPEGCHGPRAVLTYLASYVVGTAIHNQRIARYDGRCVVIKAKNYRTDEKEELPMTGEAFVRRFAQHILPDRFVRIRYAGLFAARYRKDWLAKCRELLGTDEDGQEHDEDDEETRLKGEECAETRPGPECRRCGIPDMVSTGNRTASETNDYLAYLCALFDRMFTWLSTFDLAPSPFPQSQDSYDCAADSVVITCVTTGNGCDLAITDAALPRPDT